MASAKLTAPVTVADSEAAAVWVSVAELKPWANNPRKNDKAVDRVADSIRKFGFGAPVIARLETREVIAGHTRLKAAAKLGIDRVPVRYLDLSMEDAHLLALADNKLNELASWDDELLAGVLQDMNAKGVDLSDSGFAEDELAKLLADHSAADSGDDSGVDADEVPENVEPRTKRGDVWLLGKHRLICGDCRIAADVDRLLGGAKVNVAFTSPPYASQRKYDESSGFKPIHPDKFVEWFDAVQSNVARVLADDGSWFVNIKEHCDDGQRSLYVKDLTIAHVRTWGWRFVDEFCWHKTAVPGSWPNRFRNAWEPTFHFSKSSSIRFRPDDVKHESDRAVSGVGGSPKNAGGAWSIPDSWARPSGLALPENVLRIGTGGGTSSHSAAFPVALPEFFIKAFSDPGDIIFDPFMGSGTTLIAAERNGRVGYGVELSPAYCDIIIARWEKLTGKEAALQAASAAMQD